MQNQNHLLSFRIRELFHTGKWIANTNYSDLLAKVDFKNATNKINDLNTIASLIFHINYYIEGILDYFETDKLEIHDKFSFDMPALSSADDWIDLKQKLLTNAEQLASLAESMSDEKLNSVFAFEKYGTVRRNIEAIIEHGYYHLGQVSLIFKLSSSESVQ